MIAGVLDALRPISLEALEDRAALLRRTDVKRIVPVASLPELVRRLGEDHDVLEIDGRRRFRYESVYFDTQDLRCYNEHAGDERPRFKVRTRRYVDTGTCVFEVKVKDEQGDTDKRQREHPPELADAVTEDARRLVDETLAETGVPPADPLAATLITRFERFTLAARDAPARLTIDLGVRLERLDGGAIVLRPELAIAETKSEDGDSPADTVLEAMRAQRASLSKYHVGVRSLLLSARANGAEELFVPA